MSVCELNSSVQCVESLNFLLRLSCENIALWRGHFNATGDEKSVNLSINGGEGKRHICHHLLC